MKGTHWFGLALTLAWGCDTKTEGAQNWDTAATNAAEDTGSAGSESGGTESTGGDETGGDDTGGDETGGDETSGEETCGDETGGDALVLPSGLNGTVIEPPLPPTSFSALNLDGTRRDMDDLVDGPTVMWFYPLAGSPG